MSSGPTSDDIARDATWLVQALEPDEGLARLVAMDREQYRSASFLDDRVLTSGVEGKTVPWTIVEDAASELTKSDARWIFHIGHVGSTLISRLIGEIEGVLSVREPRLLRDLAGAPKEVRKPYLRSVARIMARTFTDQEFACVKATSFASEIAPELVPTGERALFVYATPRNYISAILSGENSIRELEFLSSSRNERMRGRIPVPGNGSMDGAHRAALAWACEMTSLENAAGVMETSEIRWVDFDRMLAHIAPELASIARFFALGTDEKQLRAILEGGTMSRYSKSPDYHYSPALRAELIGETLRRHSREISDAVAMLEQLAQESPLLNRALARAKEDECTGSLNF